VGNRKRLGRRARKCGAHLLDLCLARLALGLPAELFGFPALFDVEDLTAVLDDDLLLWPVVCAARHEC
jgi:hypothetical protein